METSGAQSYDEAAFVEVDGSTATLISTDAEITFASTLDGPGSAVIKAATTAFFGGDIGGATDGETPLTLEGLDVSADFIDFSGATTVTTGSGGIALNRDGRPDVSDLATMGSARGLTFESGGDFKMGRREKLSVVGRLEINAGSNRVSVGDLSALELEVNAGAMTILGREAGSVRGHGG